MEFGEVVKALKIEYGEEALSRRHMQKKLKNQYNQSQNRVIETKIGNK